MRLQGTITQWNDERGFGFISWHGDESSVFVHVRAFSGRSRRPQVGDIVSYEIAKGRNGKSRAEKVRYSARSRPPQQLEKKPKTGPLPIVFALFFVVFIIFAACLGRISWLVVLAYFSVSVMTFFVYSWDKSSARLGKWRTSESTLHLMALAGGWPGGLAAQRFLRHKSSKQEFQVIFWVTASLNVSAIGYLVWGGNTNIINQLINGIWQNAA